MIKVPEAIFQYQNAIDDTGKFEKEVLQDFWTCLVSREVSILGRKEVLTGKAKFGIVGDGKEVPQVALARAFRKGDYRSGYYRDQTMMFALGISSVEDFFAQLYADCDNDPFSGGRQMNNHFATRMTDQNGIWHNQTDQYNTSSDISSTGGQMARAIGLALASKLYRNLPGTDHANKYSINGNEVVFCTIGDASTSEGIFWETVNAAVVQKVPLGVCVWDDGYGISVPIELQTAKGSISKALSGFLLDETNNGMRIYTAKGWDYPTLVEMFEEGATQIKTHHIPALFHIKEVTQPQGHSTSGSHERYKSKERLDWEKQYDCIEQMASWMIDAEIATQEQIDLMRSEAKSYVKECRDNAWNKYREGVDQPQTELNKIIFSIVEQNNDAAIQHIIQSYKALINPFWSELVLHARKIYHRLVFLRTDNSAQLKEWLSRQYAKSDIKYHAHLYSETPHSALKVKEVKPQYDESSPVLNGFQIINKYFDTLFEKNNNVVAFGEDVGHIGDVNQGFAGLQEKYGIDRVFDTGIREWTIAGQAIGLAMRGWRPIAEMQYLDYLIYALSALSDDLATLRYRSNGIQAAPAIIRTRGHRLEGIWHAGSPLSMLLGSLRGVYIAVPRNFVQAAGIYQTLMQSDDPAVVIECLNGYRLKEQLPSNMGTYNVPLGVPDILTEGNDVTLVTYGSCIRVAQEAIESLKEVGISVELIDVQTLMPFDIEHKIVDSLKKTNRIVFLDEDVAGGATAYMMQEVLEKQGGYSYLDSTPVTVTAYEHRTPYGSDGDYFTKPNPEDVYRSIVNLMHEANPQKWGFIDI